MVEQTVAVWSGDVRLEGTLSIPGDPGPHPAALLLSGSGPLDRDSNMAGQRLDVAKAFATGLAACGVASLRYDKRGVGMSGGEYLTASLSDETTDAGCALEALRTRPETTGDVAVIGHSVGATVAMRLARRARPPDAYVFLAGAAIPGEQVMAWQSRRIAATLPVPWRWFRRTLERRQAADRARLLASTGATLRVRRQDLPAQWFREYMTYDPAADLVAINRPVLAVTGMKDVQVDPADVAVIGRMVTGPFEGETPDDLTHVLRRDQHSPGLHRYAGQLRVPVDADLVERVASWTRAQLS